MKVEHNSCFSRPGSCVYRARRCKYAGWIWRKDLDGGRDVQCDHWQFDNRKCDDSVDEGKRTDFAIQTGILGYQ